MELEGDKYTVISCQLAMSFCPFEFRKGRKGERRKESMAPFNWMEKQWYYFVCLVASENLVNHLIHPPLGVYYPLECSRYTSSIDGITLYVGGLGSRHTQAKGRDHIICKGPWFTFKNRTTDMVYQSLQHDYLLEVGLMQILVDY